MQLLLLKVYEQRARQKAVASLFVWGSNALAKALLKGQLWLESKLAASARSLIDQPSTKVVTWSHAQPVNHFSAPSFALRLIIILRNKYVDENWDILFCTNTQSRIFYLLNNKLDENCLLIWWVYCPLDVLLYNRNNCFTQSCFYGNSSVPSFKINYISSASARSYFQKMALIYSKQKKITKHNH